MTTRKAPPQLEPGQYEVADAYAIQQVMAGTASSDAQRRAMDWIINHAASTYDMSFSPDNHSLTDFAEGRRFVGSQIVKLSKLDTRKMVQQQGN